MRLVTERKWVALANIAGAPFVIWLGLKIVQEGDTEWFGWAFAGLGIVMIIGGIYAFSVKLTLLLDRDLNVIEFSRSGLFGRKKRGFPLSDLDRVDLSEIRSNNALHYVLDFIPISTSAAERLRVQEFWTMTSAQAAHHEINAWLEDHP